MKKYLSLLSLFALIFNLPAQIIFNDNSSRSLLGTFDIESCSHSYIRGSVNLSTPLNSLFADIALHPDGRLFGVTSVDSVLAIVEVDMKKKSNKGYYLGNTRAKCIFFSM